MFDLAAWRDVAILILAVMWILVLIVVVLLLLKVKGLVEDLPRRITPVLNSAQRTASNLEQTTRSIKGTTNFVNRTAVTPIIRVAAIGAATSKFVQVLMGHHRRRGGDNRGRG